MSKEADALKKMLDDIQYIDDRERHDIYFSIVTAITRLKQLKRPREEPERAIPILAELHRLAEPMSAEAFTALGLEVEAALDRWIKECRNRALAAQ